MFTWARVTDVYRNINENRFKAGWHSTRCWEYPWVEDMLKTLGPRTIADCGCGSSPFTVRLADAGYTVFAIDNFSSVATEISKNYVKVNSSRMRFVDCNLLDIKLTGGSVDCVICISVMEHIADQNFRHREALKEMCRIVRPGGHIIVTNDTFLNPLITEWWNPPDDARWAVKNCGMEFLDDSMRDFKKEDLMLEDDVFVIQPEIYIKHGYGKAAADGSGQFNIGLYHRLTSVAYVLRKKG